MGENEPLGNVRADSIRLTVRRTMRASPERLFDAWTQPDQLMRWWGPTGVVCIAAEVDLRVGGQYRIGNRLPNNDVLWIDGEFELIDRPRELIYSWRIGPVSQPAERVRVRFVLQVSMTEVIIEHEQIPAADIRDQHQHGWVGCLDGLENYLSA